MKNNLYSNFKIFRFPAKVESLARRETSSPLYVRIKPINLCDHGCFFCVYSTGFRVKDNPDTHLMSDMHLGMKEKDKIPEEKLIEIVEDLSVMGVRAITWSGGGEPLLHPAIADCMGLAKERGIANSIITNGTLLKGKNSLALADASWVRVSIDYYDQNTMTEFRNVGPGSFQKVIDNIANFASVKNASCNLGVNYIIHENNYAEIPEITGLLKASGIENVRYSPVYIREFVSYHSKIAKKVNDQIEKARQSYEDETFKVYSSYPSILGGEVVVDRHAKVRSYKRCLIMETVPVIGADLNVYACHNKAYDDTGLIGNIQARSFSDLWFDQKTRDRFDRFDASKSCRHECANDQKNQILNEFFDKAGDPFI